MQKPQKVLKFGPNTQNSLKSMYFYEILNFKHFLGLFFRIFKLTHAKPLCSPSIKPFFLHIWLPPAMSLSTIAWPGRSLVKHNYE